jgi:hypothetical protein
MATWKDVNRLVDMMGGSHPSDTMDQVIVAGCEPDRKQKLFISYEVMKPDFEFVNVASVFAMIDLVNVEAVVRRVGRLSVGCVSYQYVYENGKEVDGLVTLASSMPLASLELTDGANGQAHFGIYLNVFGRAADTLEMEFAEPGRPDFF